MVLCPIFFQIQRIPTGYFRNLPHLKQLNLAGNRIKIISKYDFAHVTKIQRLSLAAMNISYIHPHAFLHMGELRCLDVSDTLLNAVPNISNSGWTLSPSLTYVRHLQPQERGESDDWSIITIVITEWNDLYDHWKLEECLNKNNRK